MNPPILVLGATGTVGRAVVAGLVDRGERVRAATRDPAAAARRIGVSPSEVAPFDWERPETFAPALAGADRVLLAARPGDEEADRVAAPFVAAMRTARVRHVVVLSAMGAERRDDFSLRRVERAVEVADLPFTHLRPNWFHQVFAAGALLAGIRATGAIRVPAGEARLSFVDARDVAAVAVAALTQPGHTGQAYTLTGPEALDHAEVARILEAASGRPVRYDPLDEEAARKALATAGFPAPWIERLVGFYRLVRAGLCAPVAEAIPKVLGRPARPFAAFASENAAAWK